MCRAQQCLECRLGEGRREDRKESLPELFRLGYLGCDIAESALAGRLDAVGGPGVRFRVALQQAPEESIDEFRGKVCQTPVAKFGRIKGSPQHLAEGRGLAQQRCAALAGRRIRGARKRAPVDRIDELLRIDADKQAKCARPDRHHLSRRTGRSPDGRLKPARQRGVLLLNHEGI